MITHLKAIGFLSSVGAVLLVFGAAARANDLPSGAAARAQSRCEAAHGPGFAAVEGADACVFIGGHVRVGFGNRGFDPPDSGWANGGAVRVNANPSEGSGFEVDHLRLRDNASGRTIAR